MRRGARPVLLAAAVGLGGACAQAGSPPGGEVDRAPPRVIAVSPGMFDTIADLSRPVVFRFDERLSERLEGVRDLEAAVLVSPATGVVRVDRGRRAMEVSLAGGWRPGLAYRVHVQPVFRDLFQNPRGEPIELVFSTGGAIEENALAGYVIDPLTGEPVEGARVEAVRREDGLVYVAVADSAGFFGMRWVPAGSYDIRSWIDQDRDAAVDFFEPNDTATAELALGDTGVVELGPLPGDSTAARLSRAEPLDTVTIRLLFDDYIPPGPVEASARVVRFGDSTLVAEGELVHGSRLDSIQAAREAASVAVADSLPDPRARAEQGPPAAAEEPELPGEPEPAAPAPDQVAPGEIAPGEVAGRPGPPVGGPGRRALPSRELILLTPTPLMYDSVYYVVVDDVINVHGIPDGGGSARFQMGSAPPPDTAAPAAPADSLAVPPDTVPPDTLPPDTVPPANVPRTGARR